MHISFSSVFTYIYAQAHEYACSVHHDEQLKFFSFTFTAIASNTSLNIALSFPHIQFFQKSFSFLGFVGLLVFFLILTSFMKCTYQSTNQPINQYQSTNQPINLLIQLRHHMYSRFIHVVVRTHRSFITPYSQKRLSIFRDNSYIFKRIFQNIVDF